MSGSISLDEWESNPVLQACVRLTEIENKLDSLKTEQHALLTEQKTLLSKLKKDDELVYYKYLKLPLGERQSFIDINNEVAREQLASQIDKG